MRADVCRFPLRFFRNSKMAAQRFEHFQYLLVIHCAIVEQIVTASVGASRSPHRQMRKYLPCGERFVMSLATVAKAKTRCFRNTYHES